MVETAEPEERRLPERMVEARASLLWLVAFHRPATQGTNASLEPIWMEMTSALRM